MISGLYLGELVRYVLLDLTCKKLLFRGNFPSFLKTHGSFKSLFISEIERLVVKMFICFLENVLQFEMSSCRFSGTRPESTFIPVGYWPSVSKWTLSTRVMRLLSGEFAKLWPHEAHFWRVLVSLFFFLLSAFSMYICS